MGPRVTITDVARRAGVSTATVSKVINERYGVASGTTTHVQAVIAELGYESSLVARSLRSHKTNVIGILVAEFEPFSAEILKGASTGLGDSGYALLAYTGGQLTGGVGWERRYLSRLSGTLIDGAVLVTPTVLEADAGIPVVAIDPHAGPSGLPTVDSDNFTGAVQAVQHLLGLGHRRIGFIGGRSDLESSRLREAGYCKALADAGIAVDRGLMREGDYRKDSTHEPARELLTLPERPTAVFAANDLSAIGTLEIARELGLDVPSELSIIGFDDIPESTLTTPALSTVHQPIQQMGAAAIALLITLMAGDSVEQTHIQLGTSLVERGSTAPPR